MPRRPNILWIQCDEIRADSLSCYDDNPWIQPRTPNLQRLADRGTVFENMFCPSPVCMPSRGCEMTSRPVPSLGVYHNVTPRIRDTLHFDTQWPTWPRVLRDHGYRAVNVGKLHIIGYDAWDENLGCPQFPSPRDLVADNDPNLDLTILPGIRLAVGGTYPLEHGDPDSFGASRITTLALEKLAQLQDDNAPWLLRASYIAPHTPVITPPPFDTLYDEHAFPYDPEQDSPHERMCAYERTFAEVQQSAELTPRKVRRARATYYGLVAAIDHEVGRLLERIDHDDTIVVFSGDHGTMLGEMGLWQKQMFHRKVHQIPYVLQAPGREPARRRDLADLLDAGPTLLALCGIGAPETFTGRDLFAPDLPEKDVFSAFGYGDEGAYLYEALRRGPDCPRRICIRRGAERLDLSILRRGRPLEGPDQDLFYCDGEQDPDERINRAEDPACRRRVEILRNDLIAWYEHTAHA